MTEIILDSATLMEAIQKSLVVQHAATGKKASALILTPDGVRRLKAEIWSHTGMYASDSTQLFSTYMGMQIVELLEEIGHGRLFLLGNIRSDK
jgi:hypothetical protein